MNKVKELRLSKNIPQKELARRLKISASHLNKIEAGKKNLNSSLALRIAAELNCNLDEIFLK